MFQHISRTGRPLPPESVRGYLQQIARGAAGAHGRNVFLHDLKPQNVLIELTESSDVLYLADFDGACFTRALPDPTP